jgi:putative zinc finger protein
MKPLTCASVLRTLHAFHDGELPVSNQIAVSSHLDRCGSCATALADLDRLGSILRASAPGRAPLTCDEAAALTGTIVNRAKVEHDASFGVRLHDLLEDLPVLYAGVGASLATTMCLVLMLGMMRFATIERSDSLAGILNFLATQGSNENPFVVDAGVMMPRALDATFSSGELFIVGEDDLGGSRTGRDSVVTLSAVVTREGTVANLALLGDGRDEALGALDGNDTRRVEELMDAVSRARFEPATRQGLPVAVNMVWLVTHTTVRAVKHRPLRGISKT